MKAIQVTDVGSPEVLRYVDLLRPQPEPHQVVVRNGAIGVNFIDIYQRTGRYPGTVLPLIPGIEAAGVVVECGADVGDDLINTRVAYVGAQGSYAEYTVVPAERLIPLPDAIDDQTGAAVIEQGLTAHFLSHDAYRVQPGDPVLIHAAAGGVGLLLTQMAKRRGAHVIVTVSTPAKAERAIRVGADEVVLYTEVDFVPEVLRLTEGRGVAAVYDSVGKTTFEKSMQVLRPRGTLILYGAASGPAPQIDPQRLMSGSYYLTRPSLPHYIADRKTLLARAADVFEWVQSGVLSLHIDGTYTLEQAAQAHTALESRSTIGKLLLLPAQPQA